MANDQVQTICLTFRPMVCQIGSSCLLTISSNDLKSPFSTVRSSTSNLLVFLSSFMQASITCDDRTRYRMRTDGKWLLSILWKNLGSDLQRDIYIRYTQPFASDTERLV